MQILAKNEVYRTEITDINNMGYGIARVKGIVVFVTHGVTGDLADIKIIKAASGYAIAVIVDLITPSPFRLKAPLCTAARRCGGCQYQHITGTKRRSLVEKTNRGICVQDTMPPAVTKSFRQKIVSFSRPFFQK